MSQSGAFSSGGSSSSSPLVLIQSQTVGNVAAVNFTSGITATYNTYFLLFSNAAPTIDDSDFGIQVSIDGGATYDTGNDYISGVNFAPYNSTTFTNYNAGSYLILAGNVVSDSYTANGSVYLQSWTAADFTCNPTVLGNCFYNNGSNAGTGIIGGFWADDADSINAFRIIASSGNIGGTFTLYGVKE